MRPNSTSGRHWDGSPRPRQPRRSLQVAAHSPSRLLRAGQSGRCRSCGNRIDWYQRTDHRPIALHPAEVATADVPEACRWHLSGGIAHPHDDGSGWCRLPHAALCPRPTTHPRATDPRLASLRRQLAVRSRRLIDTGTFTPTPSAPATALPEPDGDRPVRPVVRILLTHYLGESPVEDIRCIAQTRRRHRCAQPILDPAHPAGRWTLLPIQPHRGQLALPGGSMAVYDLNHLPYAEQLRWRAQRCTTHTAAPAAADLALADWQPLDPLLHAAHLHTRLPNPAPDQPHRR
ncbi:hypothetical protein G3I38_21110 [Streptomyces sp. SID7958]|uniref:Uncharacterized protein n=2 Tax=unclassified Streptomyces TaxID=2593676 RepID=A0A6G3R1Y1_9ACTN|nr:MULTISPECIES: DUF6083 domain-containing protein [unclassified Streptomyces]NEA89447.1 hypothetical protein [Streptomyces sp. SID14436]NEC81669.1 hypothetical protein [Streptomyces sp. SID7958]